MSDLLAKLNETLSKPVKLSDTEKEKVKQVFTLIHDWISSNEKEILELDAVEAYRRIGILNTQISAAQNAWLNPKVQNVISLDSPVIVPEGGEDPLRFPVVTPSVAPSAETFQKWLNALPAKAQGIAARLDCVKDFQDPEIGAEILCSTCTEAELMQCIRNEDPSYTNADTEFMKHQLGDG